MPLRCKACGTSTDSLQYTMPVLVAAGAVLVDDSGTIAGLGPVRAIETIKLGDEIKSLDKAMFVCPKCRIQAAIDSFEVVRSCYLSGGVATTEVRTQLGSIWVTDELVKFADVIFTADNANWEQLY